MTCWGITEGKLLAEALEPHRYFVIECSEGVARPAELVWHALRRQLADAEQAAIAAEAPRPVEGGLRVHPGVSKPTATQQRIVEIQDRLMLLRMEMVSGKGLPWSWCQSRLLVEAVDARSARISVTCLAVSTAEPRLVEGALRDALFSSLQTLKQRVEPPVTSSGSRR